jgi:hypothetical protein
MSCLELMSVPVLRIAGARVGHVVGLKSGGGPLVDFDDNPSSPIPARVAIAGPLNVGSLAATKSQVVLVFENGDPERPLIVGIVSGSGDRAEREVSSGASTHRLEIDVDGTTMTFEAREQITLRCGNASLTLRKDGRILLLGTDITSRATRVNKVKGGAVRIN